jgi:1-acyl-sn-glycerol-3-phosphate acyltransferase
MQSIRSRIFDVLLVLWTMILGLFIPFLMLAKNPAWIRKFSRLWTNGILLGLRVIVRLDYNIKGQENRPNDPVLYVCNHQSAWETFAVNSLLTDVAIVMKAELLRYPVFGWYLKHSPMIAIDRSGGAKTLRSMVEQARKAVADGRSVLIFAEGTRCPVNERRSFKAGVVALYRELGLITVPMAINAGVFWDDDSRLKSDGSITVSFLPPIQPGLSDSEFRDQIQTVIHNEKDRLVRDVSVLNV